MKRRGSSGGGSLSSQLAQSSRKRGVNEMSMAISANNQSMAISENAAAGWLRKNEGGRKRGGSSRRWRQLSETTKKRKLGIENEEKWQIYRQKREAVAQTSAATLHRPYLKA
jgi:hypothetical protein